MFSSTVVKYLIPNLLYRYRVNANNTFSFVRDRPSSWVRRFEPAAANISFVKLESLFYGIINDVMGVRNNYLVPVPRLRCVGARLEPTRYFQTNATECNVGLSQACARDCDSSRWLSTLVNGQRSPYACAEWRAGRCTTGRERGCPRES